MRETKKIKVGNIFVGGGAPVSVQSMLCTPNGDINAALEQTSRLVDAGCQILRLAVPDEKMFPVIYAIKEKFNIPLVADIHFDYRLALESVAAGVDKVRINPGNIGADDRVKQVVSACRSKNIPIRIGVNGGSLEKNILHIYGAPTDEAMVESALYHIKLLEKFDFDDIAVSIKSSNVSMMVSAYRLLAQKCNYPFHIGVTEAGPGNRGIIKNSIGIGALLLDGIGDTLRVSLTDDPVNEIKVGFDILQSVGLLPNRPQLISCPTCGRCNIDIISLAQQMDEKLSKVNKPITVAIMGCAVNGPGEAREADIGIAGGIGEGLLFKKGEIIGKVPQQEIIKRLMEEIESL